MKKNLTIGILSAISVFSMVFAYYQKTVAQHYEAIAIESVKRAEASSLEAEKQRKLAMMNEAEALRQRSIAIEQSELAIANSKKTKY